MKSNHLIRARAGVKNRARARLELAKLARCHATWAAECAAAVAEELARDPEAVLPGVLTQAEIWRAIAEELEEIAERAGDAAARMEPK